MTDALHIEFPPRHRRAPVALALLALLSSLLLAPGCTSWRGARLYHTGTLALEQGDVPTAVADLEAAALLVPEASEIQNNLGLAQLASGRDDLALRAFERAVELDCDNAAAHDNLGGLQARFEDQARQAAVSRVTAEEVAAEDRP